LPRLRYAVLALCAANDVKDTQSNARYGRRKPLFRATGPGGSGEIALESGAIRRHSLRHWLTDSRLLQGALARFPAQGERILASLGDVLLDRAETDLVIGALLARIARETRDRGGALHVLLLPSRDDLVREGDDYALLRSHVLSAGLPLIEVVAPLRAATRGGAQPERAYFDAMHLRPNAHALVARAVLDSLASADPSIAEALRTRARSQTDNAALLRSGGP